MRKLLEVTWVSAYILFVCSFVDFFLFSFLFFLYQCILCFLFTNFVIASVLFLRNVFLSKFCFIVLYLFFIYIVFHFLAAPPKSSSSFRPSRDEVARITVQDII